MTALDPLPPRKAIPAKWKAEAHAREDGRCYICGASVPLSGPGVEYDHKLPLWLHGAHAVSNIAPACPDPCHKAKSRREAPLRAKVNRIRKDRAGEKRKTRPFPSRPFNARGKAPLGRLKRQALKLNRETARELQKGNSHD